MKVIIAGSRLITDYDLVCAEIAKFPHPITEVVSGTAKGVDSLGELWAFENNIPVRRFPANWGLYGKRAGYMRNVQMAEYVAPSGGCIIVRYSNSSGSQMMGEIATEHRLILQETIL